MGISLRSANVASGGSVVHDVDLILGRESHVDIDDPVSSELVSRGSVGLVGFSGPKTFF